MLFSIAFPLSDARPFLHGDTGRVPAVDLLNPALQKRPFVRGFGRARHRTRGGLEGFAGEGICWDVLRALRLNVKSTRISLVEGTLFARAKFRRMISGSHSVSRIEAGFRVSPHKYGWGGTRQLQMALAAFLKIPVRIRAPGLGLHDSLLYEAGGPLAAAYLRATTRHEYTSNHDLPAWWVSSGIPAVLVEFSAGEVDELPLRTRLVDLVEGRRPSEDFAHLVRRNPYLRWTNREFGGFPLERSVMLGLRYMQVGGIDIPCWILGVSDSSPSTTELARRIRIAVLRLHTEAECLKNIMRLVRENAIVVERSTEANDPSSELQWYLSDAARLFLRNTQRGVHQQPILSAAAAHHTSPIPIEDLDALLYALRQVRRHVRKSMADLLDTENGKALLSGSFRDSQIFLNSQFAGGATMGDQNLNLGAGASIQHSSVAQAGQTIGSVSTTHTQESENEAPVPEPATLEARPDTADAAPAPPVKPEATWPSLIASVGQVLRNLKSRLAALIAALRQLVGL